MSTQSKLSVRQQQRFVQMLPVIEQVAHRAFRHRDPDTREELTAEAVAAALVMFAALAGQGRESIAYATPLARYGVARVRDGRRTGSSRNVNDVASATCRQQRGVTIERLDHRSRDGEGWREIVVEDKNAGPAEVAATRIDFGDWLGRLPARKREIAETLALGESTGKTARKFEVSAARVSQLRRELMDSWQAFVGDQSLRQHVATELSAVQSVLDGLLVDRPRRNILRRPR